MDGILQMDYLTSLSYRQKIWSLTIVEPVLVPDLTIMPMEKYYIDDPTQLTGPKPVLPFTFTYNPAVPAPPPTWTASTVIEYDIYLASTDARPLWIKSYDQTTRVATIYETDETKEADYSVYIAAWFSYRNIP